MNVFPIRTFILMYIISFFLKITNYALFVYSVNVFIIKYTID